ncbi:hypothetical protein E2C01_007907 [Portunus trituberculatus]|uniref:Uncharacterized protein n=1 Tax=Portunus trituberculatus TaxID=210409 RepID=A0A5B7D2G9_PORTR|nr:hypothetical protein [Portunus trituberculatus]
MFLYHCCHHWFLKLPLIIINTITTTTVITNTTSRVSRPQLFFGFLSPSATAFFTTHSLTIGLLESFSTTTTTTPPPTT